jgi:hypothetical protein
MFHQRKHPLVSVIRRTDSENSLDATWLLGWLAKPKAFESSNSKKTGDDFSACGHIFPLSNLCSENKELEKRLSTKFCALKPLKQRTRKTATSFSSEVSS